MGILMMAALLLNPSPPSWSHVEHACHELHAGHAAHECRVMSAAELRALGYDPMRDQGIQYGRTAWLDIFYGDRVERITV